MNIKPRSNSRIDALPAEQRQQIDQWLFEENISYVECARRCFEKFNFKVKPNVIMPYYRRRKKDRLFENLADSADKASALAERFRDDKFCEAFSLLMGQRAFENALSKNPGTPDETATTSQGEGKPPQRHERVWDPLGEASALFKNAFKLRIAKQAQNLQREKFELKLRKYKDRVAEQKQKIESALAAGKRKGGISESMLREIEEAANLL